MCVVPTDIGDGIGLETLRGNLQKKNSIFTDIAQIGGGEVNPISKFFYEIIF